MPNKKNTGVKNSDTNKKNNPSKGKSIDRVSNNFTRITDYLIEKYEFRLNIIEQQLEYATKGSNSEEYKELREENLFCELLSLGFKQVPSSVSAILGSTLYVTEYNPIQDYFKSLPKWNESDPDHIKKLTSFVKAKNPAWFNPQFKKMIVRNVAAALGHISFNKQCFVLTGGQSAGKSTFLRFLCPPQLMKYYSEEIDFISKDGVIALTQNFLINLEELDKYNKTESGHIKTFMSKDYVKVRLPYAKRPVRQKRIASFLGSTNQPQFLTDPTGNVRWLIMELEGINHDHGGAKGYGANVDIDLVYAQAYHLLKTGYNYKLTSSEIKESEINNKSFLEETSESGVLLSYFKSAKKGEATHGFNVGQMMKFLKTQTSMNLNQTRLKSALIAEGFIREDSHYFPNMKVSLKGVYLVQLIDDTGKDLIFKNQLNTK